MSRLLLLAWYVMAMACSPSSPFKPVFAATSLSDGLRTPCNLRVPLHFTRAHTLLRFAFFAHTQEFIE
uniref:Putative secreted protein n=1 Tax=Anopheles darlingi TaxID=43151 RepID=A0A2M4DME8_ANODA